MPNPFFKFKEFVVFHDRCGMKVSTEACLLGAWVANKTLNATRLLDIGSGTGLLMLMLAQKCQAIIHGVEYDEGSFLQSNENIAASPWSNRLTVFHQDIREFTGESRYDFIISNPPFYKTSLRAASDIVNLARHSTALDFPALLRAIDTNLKTMGSFAILLPFQRMIEFEQRAGDLGFFANEQLNVRQTEHHDYFRSISTFSRTNSAHRRLELSIKDASGNYTSAFRDLMKDYYLH